MPQPQTDNGTWFALGAVGLLALAGLANIGWRGRIGGQVESQFGLGGGSKKYGSRRMLRSLPKTIKKTPRSAATSTYVFPKTRDYPIGDLFHARLALIYALAPSHRKQAPAILRAVKRRWPGYNWDAWWRRHGGK